MYEKAINTRTRSVLEKIANSELIEQFYLAGGTALALMLGHRESIDLDFFSERDFSTEVLKNAISRLGNFEVTSESVGTLDGLLDGVKVSFFKYEPAPLFPVREFEGVKVADERDISAMKLSAISQRGSKKDFIDLYFLLKRYSLIDLFEIFKKKYTNIRYNRAHLLKSLAYFDDAEDEPMPKMLNDVKWSDVKEKIITEVNCFLR